MFLRYLSSNNMDMIFVTDLFRRIKILLWIIVLKILVKHYPLQFSSTSNNMHGSDGVNTSVTGEVLYSPLPKFSGLIFVPSKLELYGCHCLLLNFCSPTKNKSKRKVITEKH